MLFPHDVGEFPLFIGSAATMQETYKAVLFDLDGTLLNTIDDLADSVNSVLARYGFPTHETDAYRCFVGDGTSMLLTRAVPADRREPGLIAEYVREFRAAYARNWRVKTRPYDGVVEMLHELAEQEIKMSVLSNKPHDSTALCVGEYFPDIAFTVVQGVADGIPLKPDATVALKLAGLMACAPEQCAFLGDTAMDMATACAARMLPVGALWGFRTEKELREAGALHLIGRPSELLDILAAGRRATAHRPTDSSRSESAGLVRGEVG